MTREELTALRDAIDITLALPDSIRELLAQWLTPATAKSNGRDPHPPCAHAVAQGRFHAAPSRLEAPRSQALRQSCVRASRRAEASRRDARASGSQRGFAGEGCRRRLVDHQREVEAHGCAGADREGPRQPLAGKVRGAALSAGGPYVAAVELKAAEPEPQPIEPEPGAQSMDQADLELRKARDNRRGRAALRLTSSRRLAERTEFPGHAKRRMLVILSCSSWGLHIPGLRSANGARIRPQRSYLRMRRSSQK
jgi:hypothetical protein